MRPVRLDGASTTLERGLEIRVTTAADADRVVAEFAGQNPYMRSEPTQITEAEQRQIWGRELLAKLDAAGGRLVRI